MRIISKAAGALEFDMPLVADGTASSPEQEPYLELIRKFPLRPIRSDEELMRAIAVIRPLLARALDEGEQDDLDVLSDLVERYETEEHPMPAVPDADMLRHLIDARDITQAKLGSDVGIPDSTISEVLAGKRRLTRKHIGAIARYFGVSPSVFSF